jgi:hypothetical protein
VLHRWDMKKDKLQPVSKMMALSHTLGLYAGLSQKEIDQDIVEKTKVFEWMVSKGYRDVNSVGKIVSQYYMNPDDLLETVKRGGDFIFERQ